MDIPIETKIITRNPAELREVLEILKKEGFEWIHTGPIDVEHDSAKWEEKNAVIIVLKDKRLCTGSIKEFEADATSLCQLKK